MASTFLGELDPLNVSFAFISHLAKDLCRSLVSGGIGQPTALRHSGLHTLQHIVGHQTEEQARLMAVPRQGSLADYCCHDATIATIARKSGRGTASDLADTLLAAPDLGPKMGRFPGCLSNGFDEIVGLYVLGLLEDIVAKVENAVRLHATRTSRVPRSRLCSAAMRGRWWLLTPVNRDSVPAS